jgi:hypothetical protein
LKPNGKIVFLNYVNKIEFVVVRCLPRDDHHVYSVQEELFEKARGEILDDVVSLSQIPSGQWYIVFIGVLNDIDEDIF